jgi:hypothetical protein
MRTRPILPLLAILLPAWVLFTSAACQAAEPDPAADAASLYDVTFEATPTLAPGAQGRLLVRIAPKAGAELHQEAPITLTLTNPPQLATAKPKFGRAELRMNGPAGTFDIPFTAKAAGKGTLAAALRFYICTEKLCVPQEKSAALPVEVR